MPKLEAWRFSNDIGIPLDNQIHSLFANHFKVDTTILPEKIVHYHVSIFKYDRLGNVEEDYVLKEQDKRTNTMLIKQLLSEHPEWQVDPEGARIGLAYDGISALYATQELRGEHSMDAINQDVVLSGTKLKFSIVLQKTSDIFLPKGASDKENGIFLIFSPLPFSLSPSDKILSLNI